MPSSARDRGCSRARVRPHPASACVSAAAARSAAFWREITPEPYGSPAPRQGTHRAQTPRPAPHHTSTCLMHPRGAGAHKGAAQGVRTPLRWGPWALGGCWSCCWQAQRRRPPARLPTRARTNQVAGRHTTTCGQHGGGMAGSWGLTGHQGQRQCKALAGALDGAAGAAGAEVLFRPHYPQKWSV